MVIRVLQVQPGGGVGASVNRGPWEAFEVHVRCSTGGYRGPYIAPVDISMVLLVLSHALTFVLMDSPVLI